MFSNDIASACASLRINVVINQHPRSSQAIEPVVEVGMKKRSAVFGEELRLSEEGFLT